MSVLARNSHTSSLHKQQPSPSYDSAYRSAMSDSEGSYSSDFSGSEYDSRSDRSRSPSRSRSRGRRNSRSRSRSFSPSRSRSPAPRATKARGRPTKKPVAPKRSLLKPGAKRRLPEVYGKMPVNSARRRSNVSLHDHCRSLEKQLQELKRENKLLSDIQRRQEKALNKYEGSATELPAVVERKEEEIRVLTEQSRTYRSRAHKAERDVRSEKKKVGRLQESVDKLNKLVKNKGLKEQAALEAQVKSLSDKLKSSEDTIERLQKQLNLAEKSRDRLDREGRKGVKETQDTVKALQAELDLKTQQLVEKEKQLDVMNIRARAISQQVATLKRVKQSPLNASVGKSKKQPKPPSKAKNSTPRRALPVPAASSKRVSPSKPVSKSPAKAKATAPSPKKSPAKKAPVPKSPEPMSDSELSASDDDVDDFEDNSASESEIESDHEEEERQRKLAEQEAREAAEAKRKQEAAAAAKELQRKKDEEEAARKAKETEEQLAREAKEAERKRLFEEEKRRGEEEERKRLEEQRRIEEEAERRRLEEERIAAEKEKARLEVERAREERKKKDILLAKMKAMDKSDNGNSLPGSPAVVRKLSTPERTFTKKDVPDWLKSNKKSSPKTYEASDPIKNMHLGRPARPVQSGDSTSSRKLREDILLDTPKPSAGRARGAASKSSSLPWESSNDKPAQPKAAGGLPWENKTNGTAKPAKKESSGYTPSGFLAPKRGMKGPKKNLPWNKVTPARDFDDDGLEAIAV